MNNDNTNTNTQITIVDSMMGNGKTSLSIQMMNEDKDNNYIYITPYLSEVQRIKQECKNRKFTEPKQTGNGKLENLHKLILNNKNIASTHALFRMSTKETINLIKSHDYILILDEVMDVVEQIPLKRNDIDILKTMNLITINDNGMVSWNKDKTDFDSKYNDIKTMCDNNSVFMVNNTLMMWTFPCEIFKAFKKVYVMTYLFKGQIQRYYYDLYNMKYEYKSVTKQDDKYMLCDYISKYNMQDIKEKINICYDEKLNAIGNSDYALSKTWYNKADSQILKQLKNNMVNFYINKCKSKSKDNIWCTFKDYKGILSGKGYTKGFVSIGTRATNDYMDTYNLAYTVNNFLNPIVSNFFATNNVQIDEDTYSLSELVQWLWRSRIRQGQSINLYIPSKRMRELLENWLQN